MRYCDYYPRFTLFIIVLFLTSRIIAIGCSLHLRNPSIQSVCWYYPFASPGHWVIKLLLVVMKMATYKKKTRKPSNVEMPLHKKASREDRGHLFHPIQSTRLATMRTCAISGPNHIFQLRLYCHNRILPPFLVSCSCVAIQLSSRDHNILTWQGT